MSKDIYQHFSVEDIPFIDKGLEWIRQVEEHYAPILTPFINPHQVFILKTLGNHHGIQKIARLPVKLEVISFEELVEAESDYQEKEILVPSMRLDAFLSNVLKLSRSQTADLLERKYVQVNYHLVEKSDYQVKLGDLVSVRRFGRIILLKENGQTKKDKKKITVQLLLSK